MPEQERAVFLVLVELAPHDPADPRYHVGELVELQARRARVKYASPENPNVTWEAWFSLANGLPLEGAISHPGRWRIGALSCADLDERAKALRG